MSACGNIDADFTKLETMAEFFDNPYSFAFHVGYDLVVNGVNIYSDIEAALNDGQNGDMLNMGRDIGRALALIILGQGNQDGDIVMQPLEQPKFQGDDTIIMEPLQEPKYSSFEPTDQAFLQ